MNLPAYRAVARVARRQATRARWRSALVLATITLPIAALTATAISIRTAVPTDAERAREQFGTADLSVYPTPRTSIAELKSVMPPGSAVASVRSLTISRPIVEQASIVYFSVYEYSTSIGRPPLAGIYRMVAGREPLRLGEAVASPSVLQPLGLRIGDVLSPRPGVHLTITGTVVAAGHVDDEVVVLAPGSLASLGRGTHADSLLVDLPGGVSAAGVLADLPPGVGYSLPSEVVHDHARDAELGTAGAFAAAAFLLLATGLIAGAALAVGARRQLRTLGLLGASGADRRHVACTVLFTGSTLGLAGSAAGLALGVAVAYAVHPFLDGLAGRYVGRVEFPITPLVGALALGVVAATAAAALPARTAVRLPVVQALSERSSPPRRPGRLALAGVGVAALGAALASRGSSSNEGLLAAAGVVAMVVGILVGIPLLVTWTGGLASALPTLPRLAARDIARHGRRTGAALAAGAIAVAIPVGIAAQTLSDQVRYERDAGLAPDQLSVWPVRRAPRAIYELTTSLDALRSAFPGSVTAMLVPAATTGRRHRERNTFVVRRQSDGGVYGSSLYVVDPDALRALHAEDGIAALQRGDVVAIGVGPKRSRVDIGTITASADVDVVSADVAAVRAGSPDDTSDRYFVSPERAAELGLKQNDNDTETAVFRATHALSSQDIAHARRIVAGQPDVYVSSRADLIGGAGPLRFFATLAGFGVALVIVAVIVALLAAESRRDRAILVAVGASPLSRRLVSGASAALVGMLSVAFGTCVGFAPVAVYLSSQRGGAPIVVPWTTLGALLIGVPLVAGALSAIVSRQPRAAQLLRPVA